MRKLRVLALMHDYLVPPRDVTGIDLSTAKWKMEYDVTHTLEVMGHDVRALGLGGDLGVITEAVKSWNPHIVFNLMENFEGIAMFDQNVVSHLELLRVPYTGCNPRGLVLSRGKDLAKKLVHYHRVPTPAFVVFPMGRKVRRPPRLQLPLIVKSLIEDASMGIAQASVVETDEALAERVTFIHERIGTAAIAEQYIEGREIYVGVLGNDRRRVLPIWELQFGDLAQGTRPIATEKVKHDLEYQQRHGVVEGAAKGLSPQTTANIDNMVKRICRTLDLDGYARIDFRLATDGTPYFIEANPNPEIARIEEFAQSALHDGLKYPDLLNRILALGMARGRSAGMGQ